MHTISRRLSFSHSSNSSCNRAFSGASHIARGSNIWFHRRHSGAASSAVVAAFDDVSSKAPKRTTKKVSKAERKTLLEAFVNNYRAMNSGKFPTASEAQKEVGGGFYAVRKIIQEIEYETRMSCTSLSNQSLTTEVEDKKKQLEVTKTMEKVKPLEVEVPLGGQEILNTELPLNVVLGVMVLEGKEAAKKSNMSNEKDPVSSCQRINEEIDKCAHISDSNDFPSIDADEKPSKLDSSVSDQNNFSYKNVMSSTADDKADLVTRETDLSNEEPKVVPPTPEISEFMKAKTIAVDDTKIESPNMEEPTRDTSSKEHTDKVGSPKKSFAWNLKSLADGIINFWRKL